MENAEEVMHSLEEFGKLKPKEIPRELEEYLTYVAKTGDPVFKWALVKTLFHEKLLNVITDFYERTLTIELPPCPNVDPFNYERMKANLLEKLDSFPGAPFTVQRLSELLTNPSKEYKRADKFMRAIEKNILVVSIREPGRHVENDSDSQQESSFNGLPGNNDSSMETSFSCNDAPDADSSSLPYELNLATAPSLSSGVNGDNLTTVAFKENGENVGDSASQSEVVSLRNDEVSQEIVIEEKDTETVICSTSSSHPIEESSPSVCVEEVLRKLETPVSVETSEPTTSEPVETSEVAVDSNTSDIKESSEEAKESLIVEVTAETELVMETSQPMEEPESKDSSNVVDSSDDNEGLSISRNVNENASITSQMLEESRPIECDTSNSCDSETSNSCDLEVEIKNQEADIIHSNIDESSEEDNDVSKDADSTEINEAAPSCVETETKEESTENSVESETEASVESTEMEVGECQISHVDQSES